MFAIVRTGGKQYRVAAGDKIAVEKIPGEAGDSVTLGDVLLAGEGSDVSAGGIIVAAEIVAHTKGEKVIVFKKRRRHNYRRKAGHRQQYTILRITAVGDHKHVPNQHNLGEVAGDGAAPRPDATKEARVSTEKTDDDRLVAADAPLKAEGAESQIVDAPAAAKEVEPGSGESDEAEVVPSDAPAKSEPTASDQVDAPPADTSTANDDAGTDAADHDRQA